MFFSEETVEKYSLFGSFENQFRTTAINQTENANNREIVPFLNCCNNDTHWYNDLISHMYERDKKLQPNRRHKKPIDLDGPPFETLKSKQTSIKTNEQESSEEISKISVSETKSQKILPDNSFHYSPKSPEPEPLIMNEITENNSQVAEKETEKTSKYPVQYKKDLDSQVTEKEPEKKSKYPVQYKKENEDYIKPSTSKRELITYDLDNPNQPANKKQHNNKNEQRSSQQRNQKHINYPWFYDTKAVNIMKNWYPLKFKLAYPRRSLLNAQEQKEFLSLHSRFRNRTHLNEKEVKQYKTYSHLKNIAVKEREAFMEYSKKYYENAVDDYEFMNPTVTHYVQEMITHLESNSLSFDRYYSKQDEFSLKQMDTNQRASLELKEKLVTLGNIPKVILPSISQNSQPNLTIAYQQISKRVPVCKNAEKKSKIPISEDKNAEKLALKYNANIVMTNSSFVNFIYYLSAENSDELKMPIIIKNLKDSNNQEKKVIFIDKPFIPKDLSKREKNEKFFKRSLMVTLAKSSVNNRNKYNLRKHSNDIDDLNKSANDDKNENNFQINREFSKIESFNVDHNLDNNFESFGVVESKEVFTSKEVSLTPEVFNSKSEITTQKRSLDDKSPENFESSKKFKSDKDLKSVTELVNSITELSNTITEEKNKSNNTKIEPTKIEQTEFHDSSDYEDYNDEEENLVIETTDLSEVTNAKLNDESPSSPIETPSSPIETPSSPIQDQSSNMNLSLSQSKVATKVDEFIKLTENDIDSASEPENHTSAFKPKVIPLLRNLSDLSEQKTQKTNTSDSISTESQKQIPNEQLTLNDLLSKMQERLSAPAATATMNNPTQHMLSTLTPFDQKSQQSTEYTKNYEYIDNMHDNICYNLWELNSMRIIVRSSIDGYINTESSSLNSIALYTKLEYQSQFGGEKLSHKDYCKMWAKSFIRNNCDVILCRINVFTNKLISTKTLQNKDILTAYTNFNPQLSLNILKNVLEKISSLPENQYLLSKESNDNNFKIMKSTKQKGCFDLHFYYNSFEKNERKSNWLPLDTEIYLPYHHQLSRVPCLFEPDAKYKNSPNKKGPGKKNRGKNARKKTEKV